MTYRFLTDLGLLVLTALSLIQANALATQGLIPSNGPAVDAMNAGFILVIVAVYLDLSIIFASMMRDAGAVEWVRTVISDA